MTYFKIIILTFQDLSSVPYMEASNIWRPVWDFGRNDLVYFNQCGIDSIFSGSYILVRLLVRNSLVILEFYQF